MALLLTLDGLQHLGRHFAWAVALVAQQGGLVVASSFGYSFFWIWRGFLELARRDSTELLSDTRGGVPLLDPHWFHIPGIHLAALHILHKFVDIHHGGDMDYCTSSCFCLNIEKIIINIKASTLCRNESNIIYLGFSRVTLAVYTNLLLHINNIESNTNCI